MMVLEIFFLVEIGFDWLAIIKEVLKKRRMRFFATCFIFARLLVETGILLKAAYLKRSLLFGTKLIFLIQFSTHGALLILIQILTKFEIRMANYDNPT